MSRMYNADEVFEMGEQIERVGQQFYRKAARQSDDESVQNLLTDLADMEEDHEELFHEMRLNSRRPDIPQISFDPDHDAAKYLRATAETHVFNVHKDLAESLTGSESAEEVLRIAIDFEKDTVVFFLGLQDLVPEDLGGDKTEWLVRQEMSHIVTLTQKLRSLSTGE
ncbi:MAG: ferritin-like domain-containing protein [Planctomycetota bacterium]